MKDDTAPDGVVSDATINGLPSDCQSSETDSDDYKGNLSNYSLKLQEAINDVTPVTYGTRRRQQQADQMRMIDGRETRYKAYRIGRPRINQTIDYTE